MAHRCLGSCSLIFPFGNPHPADDFQPFTSTHCELVLRKRETLCLLCYGSTNLIPGVVQHDRAADGYTGLILHEGFELLVMIFGPVRKEGASVEECFGKCLERI